MSDWFEDDPFAALVPDMEAGHSGNLYPVDEEDYEAHLRAAIAISSDSGNAAEQAPDNSDSELMAALEASLVEPGCNFSEEDEDAQMQAATKASLASKGGEHASVYDQANQLLAELGEFQTVSGSKGLLHIQQVPASGKCFHHAILQQLPDLGFQSIHATADALSLAMLSALMGCREERSEALAAEPEQDLRRHYVQQVEIYAQASAEFTAFDYYVLDKVEPILRGTHVLDSRQYVEHYEMVAWAQFVEDLTLVILHPGQAQPAMVLSSTEEDPQCPANIAAVRPFLTERKSLIVMHHQTEVYLHYDAVLYADAATDEAHSAVAQRISEHLANSDLASAFLTSQHTPDELRRLALAQLDESRGVAPAKDSANEEPVSVHSGEEEASWEDSDELHSDLSLGSDAEEAHEAAASKVPSQWPSNAAIV